MVKVSLASLSDDGLAALWQKTWDEAEDLAQRIEAYRNMARRNNAAVAADLMMLVGMLEERRQTALDTCETIAAERSARDAEAGMPMEDFDV